MLKVYVLMDSPYHDNNTLYGVYMSLEEAKNAAAKEDGAEWHDDVYRTCVSWYGSHSQYTTNVLWEVHEFTLASADPIRNLALLMLAGDPMACDLARDILRL